MALSYYSESEAPRDFRISSTESESPYTKCPLCYTAKKNFYCVDCIKTGNFVHSSMPYSDRFADKQAKLLRLKANRKHFQDRCELLLSSKSKHSSLQIELNQCKDKIELIKLAIEQRRENIEKKKKELAEIQQHNNELALKLPRYQKRVASLGKHTQSQGVELESSIATYSERCQELSALRRARIRQLTKYIFPVYITYDSSESIEDMEFLGVEEDEPAAAVSRCRLHVAAAWLPHDGDYAGIHASISDAREQESSSSLSLSAGAALSLSAQLAALLAWTLDARLPTPLPLSDFSHNRLTIPVLESCARRVIACIVCVCALCGLAPAPGSGQPPLAAVGLLHDLVVAANCDRDTVGRVGGPIPAEVSAAVSAWWARAAVADTDDAEPEHLTWTTHQQLEEEWWGTPPAPAASLVTSAAASIASIWRGWTK